MDLRHFMSCTLFYGFFLVCELATYTKLHIKHIIIFVCVGSRTFPLYASILLCKCQLWWYCMVVWTSRVALNLGANQCHVCSVTKSIILLEIFKETEGKSVNASNIINNKTQDSQWICTSIENVDSHESTILDTSGVALNDPLLKFRQVWVSWQHPPFSHIWVPVGTQHLDLVLLVVRCG